MSAAAPPADSTWAEVLAVLVRGAELEPNQAAWAMESILGGTATSAQIAAFAVALRAKGESVAELNALLDVMYDHATPIEVSGRTLDVVGTGGDRSFSVNISTMAALVAASAGVKVVKHGNRSASSKAGSADVIEALGVPLDLPAERVARILEEVGITFCFAPTFHPALRHAGPTRSELGIGTTFNFLGPLANPVRPAAMAVGCADPAIAPLMAGVLASRGTSAWVFRGDDGLDELTTTTTSTLWLVRGGEVSEHVVDPTHLGVTPCGPEDLRGQDAAWNAQVVRRLVDGETGPIRDTVVLNAGAALAAWAEGDGSVADELAAGMAKAAAALDDGSTAKLLDAWVAAASA